MRRTILSLVTSLAILGTLQAPVAEAHGWFHPLRTVEHAVGDATSFTGRAASDVWSALYYQGSSQRLIGVGAVLALAIGIVTLSPIALTVLVALSSAYVFDWALSSYETDRLMSGKDPSFHVGPVHVPSLLDPYAAAGSNVVRGQRTRGAVGLAGAGGGTTTTNAGFMRR